MRLGHWPGTWKVACDRCGFWYASDKLKKEWNGLMTCDTCWEPRHPQDFVRVQPEHVSVPYTRDGRSETFAQICYIDGKSCYAGLAIAGCAIAGNQQYTADYLVGLSSNGH